MESVLHDLVARCTHPRDTADALSAHRQLRSALRRSIKAAEVAATSRFLSQIYDSLRACVDRSAGVASPMKSSQTLSLDDTVIAEHVFTCLALLEARVGVDATIDDHHLDVTSVMRSLASLTVNSISSMCTVLAALNPVAPESDPINFGAVSLQCLHSLLGLLIGGCRTVGLWSSLVSELTGLDVASYLCEALDMLHTRLAYAVRVASHSAAPPNAVLVGATAVALRCCSRLFHAGNAFPDAPREHIAPLMLQLCRRMMTSDLIFKLCRTTAEETRLSVAAADALVDCLAVLSASASFNAPSTETVEAARTAAMRLAASAAGGAGCARESFALSTASLAAEIYASGEGLPVSTALADALGAKGSTQGVSLLCGALGEWHCALRWATAALGKGHGASSLLVSVRHGQHDPVVLFSSLWNVTTRAEEAQLKLVHRSASSRSLTGDASVTLHQWSAPAPPLNVNAKSMYVATFGELFPKSGRVNHSKILRSSAYDIAAIASAPSAISSDAAPPPKANAKHSGLYEMASGVLGRSSFVTLSQQVGTVDHWRLDFGLQSPTVTHTNEAWQTEFVVAVAVRAQDVADVRIASAPVDATSGERQPLTARSKGPATAVQTPRSGANEAAVERQTSSTLQAAGKQGSLFSEPTALESLLLGGDEPRHPDSETPPKPSAEKAAPEETPLRREPPPTEVVDPLLSATKEDRLLLENIALRRDVERLTSQRDELIAQCSTLRHELTLVEAQVVEPLINEVSHLRQLCSDYEAAMAAAAVVLKQHEASGEASRAAIAALQRDVKQVYVDLGLEL